MMAFMGWQLSELLRRRDGSRIEKPAHARLLVRCCEPLATGGSPVFFVVWSTSLFVPLYGLLMVANLLIVALALPVWYRQTEQS